MCFALSWAARSARCRASDVGEDVGEEPEPRDQLVGPAALLEHRTDREAADHRAALDEGDHGARPRAEPCEALAVDQGLVGRSAGLREADDMTLSELGEDPGRPRSPGEPCGGAGTPSRIHECVSRASPDRSSSAQMVARSTPEVLDDAPEPDLDLPVYLPDGAGRQHCREVGEERLESQPLGEAPLGAAALSPLHQQDADEPALDEERADRRDDVPSVELPQGRLMK